MGAGTTKGNRKKTIYKPFKWLKIRNTNYFKPTTLP